MFRCDRQIAAHGGGVLLYIKDDLNAMEFVPNASFPEQVWCQITNKSGPEVYIGICYRSDNKVISGR